MGDAGAAISRTRTLERWRGGAAGWRWGEDSSASASSAASTTDSPVSTGCTGASDKPYEETVRRADNVGEGSLRGGVLGPAPVLVRLAPPPGPGHHAISAGHGLQWQVPSGIGELVT